MHTLDDKFTVAQFLDVLKTVLANRNSKINAIKIVRTTMDTGLLGAKNMVEALEAILPPTSDMIQSLNNALLTEKQMVLNLRGDLNRENAKVEVLQGLIRHAMIEGRY